MLESSFFLKDYSLTNQVYQSNTSLIYRANRDSDGLPVILKVLKEDYPTPDNLIRYKQEYQILRSLNLSEVIQVYDLQPYQQTLILIVEDFGGESLNFWLAHQQFTLQEFLEIAIAICQSLAQIHAANIIHKDINPSNIVFNPTTKQLKIIDFGISTVLFQENPNLSNPEIIEGTLAYISPEQTGRMNRALDYRTDFYSLGATFYHLLTGTPPFAEAEDAMELVHCHLAKQPVSVICHSPSVIGEEIPQIISDIVMKLMAKAAEDRYHSAWGIKADLEECLQQLQNKGIIKPFTLGEKDNSDRFAIPQKLYGREKEIERLLAAFTRVTEFQTGQSNRCTSELVLVTGYSGIGKSSVIREIYKPITAKRGYFIAGKFDQFQRNIPYSALLNALKELVQFLLTQTQVQLEQWREQILTAVGINGKIIIDVLPEIELIIGKQPEIAPLMGQEAQNRFDRIMIDFISVFCSPAHPLVIFLDDLQWIDLATLHLIQLLLEERKTAGLFLIGAYRDNEIHATHPLEIALEKLRQQGRRIEMIRLRPLLLEDLNRLIADTLQTATDVTPLANVVWQKTQGNPFFVNQLLKTLYEAKAIAFDRQQKQWQWHLEQIEQMDISDNVVDLVTKKLKQLPQPVQEVLQIAAAIGAKFDLDTLSIVCQQSATTLFEYLKLACQAQIIFPTSVIDSQLLIQNYKFAHDRIQQAAYSLIYAEEKSATHLKIGRLLWHSTTLDKLSERILEIVDHLNLGLELVTEAKERQEIAQLNLMAGQKAKSAAAYSAAIEYLRISRELLAPNSWQNAYDLTFKLYFEAMETALFATKFEQAEALGQTILQFSNDLFGKIQVYKLNINIYIARNQKTKAIETGLEALAMLRVSLINWENNNLPELPSLADISQMPEMVNLDILAALDLLVTIIPPVHQIRPDLFPSVAVTAVQLCLQHGKTAITANAFGVYGLFLNTVVGDLESAYHAGKLSLALLHYYQIEEFKARITLQYIFVAPGKEHLQQTLEPIKQGIISGYQVGHLEVASYCIMGFMVHLFLTDRSLKNIVQQHQQYLELIIQSKQEHSIEFSRIWQQVALNFCEGEKNLSLEREAFDETKMLPIFKQTDNHQLLFTFYLAKLILTYNFKDYQSAIAHARNAAAYQHAPFGLIMQTSFTFYESLALLTGYPESSLEEQAQILNKVEANLNKIKYWAECAPMNFLHQYYLVAAEKARVLGENWQAGQLYQQAISSARESGYLQQQALANELAAQFYLAHGIEQVAQCYFKEAHYVYNLWQSKAKVTDLETRYPQFFRKNPPTKGTNYIQIGMLTTISDGVRETIDLATVIKASQAVAREISLDKLLATLMKIAIENAGAQRGYLILETNGKLFIEAYQDLEQANTPQVLRSQPIENNQELAISIVNYVWRTQESVVLSDASCQTQFINDSYLENYQPRSIVCTPLIDRGRFSGVVYLENNLTVGAFTAQKLEMIQMLSGLAEIAIDNARLYNSLEQKVIERTQELSEALENLQATQEQLIESEKMAALGNLVAGVAHEINTPVGNSITAASTLTEETNTFVSTVTAGQLKRSNLNQYLDLATEASEIILSNLQRAGELIQSFKQVAVDHTSLEKRTFALKLGLTH